MKARIEPKFLTCYCVTQRTFPCVILPHVPNFCGPTRKMKQQLCLFRKEVFIISNWLISMTYFVFYLLKHTSQRLGHFFCYTKTFFLLSIVLKSNRRKWLYTFYIDFLFFAWYVHACCMGTNPAHYNVMWSETATTLCNRR